MSKKHRNKLNSNIKFATTITKSVGGGVISPMTGLIKEINEYQNSLNSYRADYNFTDEMVDMILLNPFVRSKLTMKLNKALAFNGALNYDGAKKAVSKFIEAEFMPNFAWRDLARQVMYSRFYGKAVIRVFWNEENKIEKTVGLDHKAFIYNTDYAKGDIGDLIYNNINLTQEYPYNFIVIYNEADAKYPFGRSDLRELYPTVKFFNFLSMIESRYFNKAVIPAFVASYDSDKSGQSAQDESDLVSSLLAQIENGAGVAIANLKSLYTLMENGQVNFNSTFERLKNTISIVILGSDMTDSQKNGTYAQAKASTDYIEGNVKDLAVQIQTTTNKLIAWQVWALWGADYVSPKYLYDMQEPYSLEILKFMKESGYPISARQAAKILALPSAYVFPEDDVLRVDESLVLTKESDNSDNNSKEDNPNNNTDNSDDK
jgi:hypothetical protein